MGRGRGTGRCGRAEPEPIGRGGRGTGRCGRAEPEPIGGPPFFYCPGQPSESLWPKREARWTRGVYRPEGRPPTKIKLKSHLAIM